ncbi:MAG: hypothetical protein E6J97_00920 [Methanobacteriota archaeon]|nr:MAG: hypothetical protein E6J97_00920 [Euryarchaeota archaeon]
MSRSLGDALPRGVVVRRSPFGAGRTIPKGPWVCHALFVVMRLRRGVWRLWLVVVSLVLEIPGVVRAILRM